MSPDITRSVRRLEAVLSTDYLNFYMTFFIECQNKILMISTSYRSVRCCWVDAGTKCK